ncbi:MAG: FosX/FosE/FosI family fosfomycin resistance hydrolase [Oscillospiraceae bacterium]|nr:FosX/FosE/FosI family fosfomycin resistance hydrolase [Oscillospiraceae bacterium]
MISSISHITFIVQDLELATIFWENIFEAKEVYSSGDKIYSISKEKFFLVGNVWICIMEGDSLSERTYNHTAFQINDNEFEDYLERIKNCGVEIKQERLRVEGEGRSIYFYDFDNHLFELHTGSLDERLRRYSMDK